MIDPTIIKSQFLEQYMRIPPLAVAFVVITSSLVSANYGGSGAWNLNSARAAMDRGDYVTMQNELDFLIKDWGADTLRLNYAEALLLQAQAAEKQGNYQESLDLHKRYGNIRAYIDNHQNRFTIVILILLFALALLIYQLNTQHEEILLKNEILTRQISEAIQQKEYIYREKYLQPVAGTEAPAIQDLDNDALYAFLRDTIFEKQLYLDPQFGRQYLIDNYDLSKEKIGRAFSANGTSLPQFVNLCRLEYACVLLKSHPEMSVADIAKNSGFTTRESFFRSFKQQYALSPSEYKASIDSVDK